MYQPQQRYITVDELFGSEVRAGWTNDWELWQPGTALLSLWSLLTSRSIKVGHNSY